MAERVEFELTLKDGVTPQLKAMRSQGIKTFDTLIKKSKDFNKTLSKAKQRTDSLNSSSKSLVGTISKLGLAYYAIRAAKMFLQEQIRIDQATLSFETFYKSAETADKVMTRLMRFANVTPFDDRQVIAAGRSLAAFGIQAKQLEPTMRMLGDISAATGKDLVELTNIYGKTKQLGRVYNYQINQLARSGIPIITELAKVFGTSEMAIRKMAKEGKISFADMQKAFIRLTAEGGMFHNLMAKQAQTLGGRISTLWGKFQLFGAQFSTKVIDPIIRPFVEFGIKALEMKAILTDAFKNILIALKPIKTAFLDTFTTFNNAEGSVQSFSDFIKADLAPVVYNIARVFGELIRIIGFLIDIIKPFKWVILGVVAAIKLYSWATKIATAVQWAWNAAMTANPIGLIIVGIAALVGAILWLWNNVDGFRNFWLKAWNVIVESVKFAGTFLKNMFLFYKAIFFDPIINTIAFLAKAVKKLFNMETTGWDKLWSDYKQTWVDSAKAAVKAATDTNTAWDKMNAAIDIKNKKALTNSDSYKINWANKLGFKPTKTPEAEKQYKNYSDQEVKLINLSGAEGDGTAGAKGSGLKGASKVGGSIAKPSIVNIDFHPVLEIEIVSNELPEATEEIQKQFERMIVDVANISGRAYQ